MLEWSVFCPNGCSAVQAAPLAIGEIATDVSHCVEQFNGLESEGAARFDLPLQPINADAVVMCSQGKGILFRYRTSIKPLEGQDRVEKALQSLKFIAAGL